MDELSLLSRIWKRAAQCAATDKAMEGIFSHDAIGPLPQLAHAFALRLSDEDNEWTRFLRTDEVRAAIRPKGDSTMRKRAGHGLARAALDPSDPAPPVISSLAWWMLGERSTVALAGDMLAMEDDCQALGEAWWTMAPADVAQRFFKKYPVQASSAPAQVSEPGQAMLAAIVQRAESMGVPRAELAQVFAPLTI